jgi:hypothetical protein
MRAIRQGLTNGGYEALRDRVNRQFAAPGDDPQWTDNAPIQARPDAAPASITDRDE